MASVTKNFPKKDGRGRAPKTAAQWPNWSVEEAKPEPEAKLQVNIVSAPAFDPSTYVRDTYGPIAEPLSCLKAILRELVILNHRG